ncbi:hypothetical protein P43SY_003506 [Pythium insidiosum]|uniref:Amino acid transporter n=1 Tax=Pythium insidiosum TaxID=114742 RepID=A0AAD5LFJ9_PYTIN|nr:hypothetical protein P43SY_003506 [Pythium insidiosum]
MATTRGDGVVLFDDGDARGRHRSSLTSGFLSPPALFLEDRPQPPIKLSAKDAATTSHTNGDGVFFISPGGDTPMMYPDDGEDSRPLAFFRRTTTQILICVALGVGLGVLLSNLEVSKDVSALVNLPGAIFLRVLRCFVLPMVFCSLATGAANIVLLGKVSAVGARTALYFLACSTAAAVISLLVALTLRASLQSDHQHKHSSQLTERKAFLHVACAPATYLEQRNDSTLACGASAMSSATRFQLVDLGGVVLNNRPLKTVRLEEQITGILQSVLPVNIFRGFQDGVLMSVITFAVAFGAAAIRVGSQQTSPLLEVLNQLNKIFFFVISKLIDWSPLAVLSLIAGSLSSQRSLTDAINHVGILVLTQFVAVVILELVFYPTLLWVTTRRNPFAYMRQMLPCVSFAFGSASSLATLPITLRCVESTREVSRNLVHFVVTIGCTVHMNGTAMMFPNAIVFLAASSGKSSDIGWVELILILVISVLSSIGVAPIPNGGLVMVYSIWSTVFPNDDVPITFSYLVAIYWYIDRVNTMCNVVGDTYVSRLIAEQVDETFDGA